MERLHNSKLNFISRIMNNLLILMGLVMASVINSCGYITNQTVSNNLESLKKEKEIYIAKYKNGTTALIKERKDTKAVSIQVWFGVGSVFEKDKERGLSHFLEHMLFNGTKYTKPGEIEAEIEKKGGYINAATSKDYTFYYIEIASPFWKKALTYLYYMTTAPTLSQNMVEKEKPIVLEELNRHLDNPKSKLWDRYYELAYKVSNYKYPVIGFRKTIEKFNEKLVKNYFYSHYVPSNTYIVVVGNVNKDEVLKEIDKTWGSVKGEYYRPEEVPLEPKQTDIRTDTIRQKQITRAYVIIGWQVPPVKDKKSFVGSVLEEILFNGRTSVFYQKLRETGLVNGIYGGYMGHRGTSQFLIYFITTPEKVDKVKTEIFKTLKEFRENGVPEEMVENAKNRIVNREVFSREEVSNEAENIGYAFSVVGNIDYELNFTKYIQDVKKEDIDKFLKEYIKDNNYTEVKLLPEK